MKRLLLAGLIVLSGCAIPKKKTKTTPEIAFMGGLLVGSQTCADGKLKDVLEKLDALAAEVKILKGRVPAKKFGKGKLTEGGTNADKN